MIVSVPHCSVQWGIFPENATSAFPIAFNNANWVGIVTHVTNTNATTEVAISTPDKTSTSFKICSSANNSVNAAALFVGW